jgi:hypothetical protein
MCELERFGIVEPSTLPVQLCCFVTSGTPVEVVSWLIPKGVDAVQANYNELATYFIEGESGKKGVELGQNMLSATHYVEGRDRLLKVMGFGAMECHYGRTKILGADKRFGAEPTCVFERVLIRQIRDILRKHRSEAKEILGYISETTVLVLELY